MFICFNLKRFLSLLLLDAFIIVVCFALFFTGKLLFSSPVRADGEAAVPLPVIMYHSVREGVPNEYTVTPAQLEADLKWLSENGFTSITAQQLVSFVHENAELPEKPVMITFDDGYYNNLSLALPLLEKYDMHAVVSIVGRYTDDIAPADPHIDTYSYLTWEDISALTASGHVEIGCHTYDLHSLSGGRRGCAIMDGEDEEDYAFMLESDLSLCQHEIKQYTGEMPLIFAYPYGSISRESIPVIKKCGFMVTLTSREGMNYITHDQDCLYGIFRFNRSGLHYTDQFMESMTKSR